MEEIIDSELLVDLVNSLQELLVYESTIKSKKETGISLQPKEKFFDDYFFPPSLLVRMLSKERVLKDFLKKID